MKCNAKLLLVINILAVLIAGIVLIGATTSGTRILFVVLLAINSASLPGSIDAARQAND